jgi:hypothetical protein
VTANRNRAHPASQDRAGRATPRARKRSRPSGDHPIARCATCDSTEFLQDSHGKGGLNNVCRPCFFIWYDGDIPRDGGVRGEDMRDACLKAKANGTWPFQPGSEFAA